ncbi:MAG: 6-pyruvoyl-tetrahydropterin synthase-related protein [Acidobacteriota bacterium]
MRSDRAHVWADGFLLLLVSLFLFSYFEPRWILSDTTPAGGDTPSHFTAATLFRDLFLHHFKLTGWDYGNLAGYPLFQYYFPFPFILCAILSLLLPLTVSFKIVTILGPLLLPYSCYYFLRRLGFPFPAPILGSASALLFLFAQNQSMWGGNIPSTLAGEFTYSLAMGLALIYLANIYLGIQSKQGLLKNAALLALVGLNHGCALLVAGLMPLFCVFLGSDTSDRVKYYVKVNLLAFLFMAFWLLPWLGSQEYMTAFNFRWAFHSAAEFFSLQLIPFFLAGAISGGFMLLAVFRGKENRFTHARLAYLWFGALVALVFFNIGHQLNVVDVRFLPFLQLFVGLNGAAFLGELLSEVPVQWAFASGLVLLAIYWTDGHSAAVRGWIKWNYEGFEAKPNWPVLREATHFLKGSREDPRVVYEHSSRHNQFGSVRTFESLPYFSGRSTLEGVYLQSSVNSPFIFYLQSEISQTPSCPLPDYLCASLNLERALPRLRLFNVSQLILRSKPAKQKAGAMDQLVLEKSVPPLDIYRVRNADPRYVVPLACPPVLYQGQGWKRESFRWFRHYTADSSTVVMDRSPAPTDLDRFAESSQTFPWEKECPSPPPQCQIQTRFQYDRIQIHTECPQRALLIKMSYHPRWKVKGASKVYLATPGFMLVFPRQETVELTFGWAAGDYLGAGLSLFGVLSALLSFTFASKKIRGAAYLKALRPDFWLRLETGLGSSRGSRWLKITIAGTGIAAIAVCLLTARHDDPNVLFEEGLKHYSKEELDVALGFFRGAALSSPQSSFGVRARFFWGLCLYRLQRYSDTTRVLGELVAQYPESAYLAEALYHVGLSRAALGRDDGTDSFQRIAQEFPHSRWARLSRERLEQSQFDLGLRYFDREEFDTARQYFQKQAADRTASRQTRAMSQYYVAISDFKQRLWSKAVVEFDHLIAGYPDSPWTAEALYHLGLCYRKQGLEDRSRESFKEVLRRFQGDRWADYAREELEKR